MKRHLARAAYAAASLGLHAWLLSASPGTASERKRAEPPPLLVQLAQPEPPKPAPPPEPHVEAAEKAPPPAPAPVAKVKPAPAPEPPAEKPPEAAPPELTGTTLTSDAEASWSAPPGSGNERDGLLRTGAVSAFVPPTVVAKASAHSATSQALARPEPTPLAQLSRKPVPPPLADALERHYPVAARRLGRSGEALVRARIEANGVLSEAQMKSETAPGFGAACRQALLASRWTGPLDRDGRPVATYITYRCKFVSE
ncbi:MAG TPA: energy transducer TonB [Polyangiaceae bacterium]|nr:energy transducer TonB [Polyangiaceae bacterium]